MNEEYKNGYRDGFLDGWNARNQPNSSKSPNSNEKIEEPSRPPKNFQSVDWPDYAEWQAKSKFAPEINKEL